MSAKKLTANQRAAAAIDRIHAQRLTPEATSAAFYELLGVLHYYAETGSGRLTQKRALGILEDLAKDYGTPPAAKPQGFFTEIFGGEK